VEIRCPSCSYSYDYDRIPEHEPARREYIARQVEILEAEHPHHD